MLKKEQDMYNAEGIQVERINPLDNEDVLVMIEARQGGLFVLLDEELKIPKGNDLSFLQKVEKVHNGKGSGRFRRDFRMAAELFEIKHFAGTVTYNVTNFMEKNRDKMYDHLEDLLVLSRSERFRSTMTTHGPRSASAAALNTMRSPGKGAATGQSATIVARFTKQLNDLMVLLNASQPHFVKCVKPNNAKRPKLVDTDLVLRQLRYSGVLEVDFKKCIVFVCLYVCFLIHIYPLFHIFRPLKSGRAVIPYVSAIRSSAGYIASLAAYLWPDSSH